MTKKKKRASNLRDEPETPLSFEDRKTQLEVRELEEKLKYAFFSRLLTALGGVSFLIVLFVNSQLSREQRQAEARSAAHTRKLERMTSVATEFDRLYARTLEVTTKAELGSSFVVTWHEMLIKNAEALSAKETAAQEHDEPIDTPKSSSEIHQYLQAQLDEYKDRKFSLGDFTSAVTIENQWKSRQESFSPDFSQLFGDQVQKAYPAVSSAAQALLVDRVGFSFDANFSAKDDFVNAASTFQKAMYAEIRRFSAAGADGDQ